MELSLEQKRQSMEYCFYFEFAQAEISWANADFITFAMSICYTFISAFCTNEETYSSEWDRNKDKQKSYTHSGNVYLRCVECNKIHQMSKIHGATDGCEWKRKLKMHSMSAKLMVKHVWWENPDDTNLRYLIYEGRWPSASNWIFRMQSNYNFITPRILK